MQVELDACHIPPAFSQSACVLKVDRSTPDGLAEGAPLLVPEEPLDEPGVLVVGSLLVDPPVVPEGLLVPGLLPPLPLPVFLALERVLHDGNFRGGRQRSAQNYREG